MSVFKVGRHEVILDDQDDRFTEGLYLAVKKIRNTRYCLAYRRVEGKTIYAGVLHRIILNPPKSKVVDHINGDGLDNRRSNLRITTNAENIANRRSKVRPPSGYFGVYRHRTKWEWAFNLNGKRYRCGGYEDPSEAARGREEALDKLNSQFHRRNA